MINLREVYYDKCPERLQFIKKKQFQSKLTGECENEIY